MENEMRKYIDTFKQKLTELENLNISDDSELENLNISDDSDSLSPKETLTLLMKIWERIPLGTRMNSGGMEREIPKEIRELLDKFGYKIVKK